jgi:hypothetical protein
VVVALLVPQAVHEEPSTAPGSAAGSRHGVEIRSKRTAVAFKPSCALRLPMVERRGAKTGASTDAISVPASMWRASARPSVRPTVNPPQKGTSMKTLCTSCAALTLAMLTSVGSAVAAADTHASCNGIAVSSAAGEPGLVADLTQLIHDELKAAVCRPEPGTRRSQSFMPEAWKAVSASSRTSVGGDRNVAGSAPARRDDTAIGAA